MPKKRERSDLDKIILGLFLSLIAFSAYEANRKKRYERIQSLINGGFQEDARNIAQDWNNVGSDIRNAMKKVVS